jgi:subtilisin family serine protease
MKIKVMFLILCFSFCFANSKDVFASSDQQIDLLLKSEVDIVQVKDIIMQMNPELEITVIPEINLLRISASKDMDIERIFSNDIVKDSIEDSGKLNPIIVEDIGIKNTIIDGALSETRANMSAVEFFDKMAWHVDIITNNRKAIEISNGNGTNIALIDSGVDETHPILENKLNFDNAKSFIEGEEIKDISDRNGHGTMVAGNIAQIAPGAVITPYKVISEKSGDSIWLVQALIQAVKDKCDIINMSLGTFKSTDVTDDVLTINAFQRAVDYANSEGLIIVAAAGNYGFDLDKSLNDEKKLYLPGCLEGVVNVSSEHKNELSSYSDYGSSIQFTAPGGDIVLIDGNVDASQLIYCIYPTYMDNGLSSSGIPQGYTFSYGTSLSSAEVSASLADVLAFYKKESLQIVSDKIVSALAEGCTDLGKTGYDSYFGNGLLNLEKSLNLIIFK